MSEEIELLKKIAESSQNNTTIVVSLITGICTVSAAGVSTFFNYLYNKRKFESDKELQLKMEFLKRKIEVLVFATEKLEIYLDALSMCYAKLTGLLSDNVEPGPLNDSQMKFYKEADLKLQDAWKDRDIAISRLKLLGLNDAASAVLKIGQIEVNLRQLVVFKKQLPSFEHLEKTSSLLKSHREEIYSFLTNSFTQSQS